MENEILLSKYDIMKEQLKDNARSIKFIKNLGKQLIEKMKIIDDEIHKINPDKKCFKDLSESDKEYLTSLYRLRQKYRSQFDMIRVILNKSDDLLSKWETEKYKETGLDDKFFIKIEE